MAIKLKARESQIQVGDLKGPYRYILGTELYGKLSECKSLTFCLCQGECAHAINVEFPGIAWERKVGFLLAWRSLDVWDEPVFRLSESTFSVEFFVV